MTSITGGHQHGPPRLLPCLAIGVVLLLLLGIQLPYSLGATYRNQTAVVPLPAAWSSCLPDQASALLQLKRSFFPTNESAATFRSWRAALDCCSWEGVGCDTGGHVTALDLGGCGLKSGGLHLALFNLTSLRHLNLGGNDFSSSQLPAVGFERLAQLTNLNLSSANFQGLIPAGIGRLTKLVILDLSSRFKVIDQDDEYLSIAEPWPLVLPSVGSLIANLSNLEELYLGTVDLSGNNGAAWCRDLANSTPRLQVLSLPDCYLSGPICGSLFAIPSLTVVNLQYNVLYGQIPEPLADLPSLSVLTLTANHLEGWLPTRIFHNRNLTSIDIRYNFGLSGLLPNFSENSILTDLLVSSTSFSGPIPSSISNLRSLNKLGVAAGDFSQELPSSIGQLRSLSSLEVTGAVVGAIPSWITNLTSLVMLQFSNCGLSGEVPSSIGSLQNLTRLQLYKCNFSGRIPPQIFNLTQLQALYLQSNNFLGVVKLSSFWKLRSLSSLNLSNNKFTVLVDGEDNYSMVSQMYSLGLASCNISKFPNTMKHMRHISYLDLSDNQIHGSIPQWAWETWSRIIVLNISHNKINQLGASYVPPGNIEIMDLSSNLFEGSVPIPGSYTELLDCSDNRFSSIPLNFGSQVSIFYISRPLGTASLEEFRHQFAMPGA